MGQYFKAYVENSASKSLGKMMEFGYMHQSYVATICTMIYQNPQIVAFVGDYASGNKAYDVAWNQGNEELDMNINSHRLLFLCSFYINVFVFSTAREYSNQ